MFRQFTLILASCFIVSLALAQNSDHSADHGDDHSNGKHIDVQSSAGDLHMGSDADARKIGLALYPGARLKPDDEDNSSRANLSLFTEAFGFKLLVAKYESDDPQDKVISFYRDQLKKYGKVLECHSTSHGAGVDMHDDDNDKDSKSKELKCEQSSGPVTELKVGTEDDQHVVGIEPRNSGKGTTFSLVYVRARGKRGEL